MDPRNLAGWVTGRQPQSLIFPTLFDSKKKRIIFDDTAFFPIT